MDKFRKSQFCFLRSSENATTLFFDMLGLEMANQGIFAYLTITFYSYIDGPARAVIGLLWHGWLGWQEEPEMWSHSFENSVTSMVIEFGYPFFLFFHSCLSSSLQTGSGYSSWDRCKNRKLSSNCGMVGVRTDSNPWPLLSLSYVL